MSHATDRDLARRISTRPIADSDFPLLLELYATTREAEMAMVPWPADQKQQFVSQQFFAQHTSYHNDFPEADYLVVLLDGQPIGRMYVGRAPDLILLMEITLKPMFRNRGIGTFLLSRLLREAQEVNKPVRLHVEEYNPAKRLYERFGFTVTTPHPVHCEMEWLPSRAIPKLTEPS